LNAVNLQRVFVSSVVKEYEDRRRAAREAILEAGLRPVLAEDQAAARPAPPRDIVLNEELFSCDAIVGIYGHRYGWVNPGNGLSPTEEEYDWARKNWKPIYAFIDRMGSQPAEAKQLKFLGKVQNWDTGVSRGEFRSLADLKTKIKEALTLSDSSPRFRAFLTNVLAASLREGYRELAESRLPVFALLLYKPPSTIPMMYDPHKVIAVIDADRYDHSQIGRTFPLWKQTLSDFFQESTWSEHGVEACLVVVADRDTTGLASIPMPHERSARFGGYYGVRVALPTHHVDKSDLRLKDRSVQVFFIEPILEPALTKLAR
jgi:hypothetical protein